jgi:hypothetical protein
MSPPPLVPSYYPQHSGHFNPFSIPTPPILPSIFGDTVSFNPASASQTQNDNNQQTEQAAINNGHPTPLDTLSEAVSIQALRDKLIQEHAKPTAGVDLASSKMIPPEAQLAYLELFNAKRDTINLHNLTSSKVQEAIQKIRTRTAAEPQESAVPQPSSSSALLVSVPTTSSSSASLVDELNHPTQPTGKRKKLKLTPSAAADRGSSFHKNTFTTLTIDQQTQIHNVIANAYWNHQANGKASLMQNVIEDPHLKAIMKDFASRKQMAQDYSETQLAVLQRYFDNPEVSIINLVAYSHGVNPNIIQDWITAADAKNQKQNAETLNEKPESNPFHTAAQATQNSSSSAAAAGSSQASSSVNSFTALPKNEQLPIHAIVFKVYEKHQAKDEKFRKQNITDDLQKMIANSNLENQTVKDYLKTRQAVLQQYSAYKAEDPQISTPVLRKKFASQGDCKDVDINIILDWIEAANKEQNESTPIERTPMKTISVAEALRQEAESNPFQAAVQANSSSSSSAAAAAEPEQSLEQKRKNF